MGSPVRCQSFKDGTAKDDAAKDDAALSIRGTELRAEEPAANVTAPGPLFAVLLTERHFRRTMTGSSDPSSYDIRRHPCELEFYPP